MSQILSEIQVNIPFTMLYESYLPQFLENGLNPEIGFDAAALDQFSLKDFEGVARQIRKRGLSTTLHAPYLDLSPGSLDSAIRSLTKRRFQQIFKELCTGKITGDEALRQVDEAEGVYGPAREEVAGERKSADECIEAARIDISMAIRAAKKPLDKRNEHEHDTLRELSKELLPNGYFIVGATDRELLIGPMDADAWEGDVGVLREYSARL